MQGGFSFYHFSEEDLNAKNSGGYTPLMYAAYIGHDNVVNMLIDAQVDVNLSNDKGHSPLMLAASCGNESVCEFLKDVSKQCLFMIYPKQLYYFGGYIIIRVSSPLHKELRHAHKFADCRRALIWRPSIKRDGQPSSTQRSMDIKT